MLFVWKTGVYYVSYLKIVCFIPQKLSKQNEEVKFHFFFVANLLFSRGFSFPYEILFTLVSWALGLLGFFLLLVVCLFVCFLLVFWGFFSPAGNAGNFGNRYWVLRACKWTRQICNPSWGWWKTVRRWGPKWQNSFFQGICAIDLTTMTLWHQRGCLSPCSHLCLWKSCTLPNFTAFFLAVITCHCPVIHTIEMDLNEIESVVTLWVSFVKQAGVIDSEVERHWNYIFPSISKCVALQSHYRS